MVDRLGYPFIGLRTFFTYDVTYQEMCAIGISGNTDHYSNSIVLVLAVSGCVPLSCAACEYARKSIADANTMM